ncbi:MAG: ABC transporter permease subunit [Tissierellia bacterium]|nr:ABC transporter permease subunit [Tissierellia bacterium]
MRDFTLKDKRLSTISKLILLGLWVILSEIIDNEVIFPTLGSTLKSLIEIVKTPDFISIIASSLLRSLIGFLISLFLAVLTGILSSISKFFYNVMIPILNFLGSVPTMAIIILALIWLNNEIVPMFVGFIMIFPILYETVQKGILNVDKKILEICKLYKVRRITLIKDIYIPSIFINLSMVFTSALSTNLKMVIAGEALSQPKFAIGSNLQIEKMYLNTAGVFAWIIIILLISKLLSYIMKAAIDFTKVDKWM